MALAFEAAIDAPAGDHITYEADAAQTEWQETADIPNGGGFTSLLGAVLSLALLVGLGVWGYRLAVRDVSGIPVVRALEGPMRIQPDDPGGESAAYQGFSVNAVQADGGAEAPADRLALAPRNVGLAPEDAPIVSGAEVSALPASDAAAPEVQVEQDTVEAQMLALADQLTEGVAPLSGAITDITPTAANSAASTQEAANNAVAVALLAPEIIAASTPGVSRSPHPVYRPEGLVATDAIIADVAPAPVSATGSTVQEMAAADIPVGTRLVQLGAFDSEEIARGEWDRLMVRFEDYLSEKVRVIEQASSGGKTFYRLRALGFDDLSDARRFCAALMTGQAACIPVMTR